MVRSFIKHLSFNKRDISIPADYRPLYKIGHIILILFLACRSNKATLMKLHFLCWSIKSDSNLLLVQQWINNNFRNDYHIWGVEPTVNRALMYAVAEGYIALSEGNYGLTDIGIDLYKLIKKDKDLYVKEKAFLETIGKNGISEQKIKDLSSKFL
jgi:hypothetical protein